MIHALKTEPRFYEPAKQGLKPFEVRKNDRDFKIGDYLALNEYDPEKGCYTGRAILEKILYILDDERFVPTGYVILGTRVVSIDDSEFPFNPATKLKQEVTRE